MRTEVVKVDYQTTKLDLNFWVEEINDSIVLTLYYASNLFERITIERFLNHFEDVLLCVVDSTDSLIADVAFSGTLIPESPPPPTVTKSLIERFAQQVCLTPDQAAVVGRGGSLTYSELERLTNRIARLIAAHPEALSSPIGLLLGREGLSCI
ncbi:MAG: condensation domain-containing protein, partial [Microcystis panniformis]